MGRVFSLPLTEIQPSQLYISTAKLARIAAWWQPPRAATLPPIPVKLLDGIVTFTDGHTRALAAYRRGFRSLPVYWDPDDLDWEAYRICVVWCRAAAIRTVMDLNDRLLAPDLYDVLWLDRCRSMQAGL